MNLSWECLLILGSRIGISILCVRKYANKESRLQDVGQYNLARFVCGINSFIVISSPLFLLETLLSGSKTILDMNLNLRCIQILWHEWVHFGHEFLQARTESSIQRCSSVMDMVTDLLVEQTLMLSTWKNRHFTDIAYAKSYSGDTI